MKENFDNLIVNPKLIKTAILTENNSKFFLEDHTTIIASKKAFYLYQKYNNKCNNIQAWIIFLLSIGFIIFSIIFY
jgi:hypothetical protein